MLLKSISERSAPHHGIGRASKCSKALRRRLRIQSGSDLRLEISSTTAGDNPRLGSKIEWDASFQPKRYPLSSSFRCSSWLMTTADSPFAPRSRGRAVRPESLSDGSDSPPEHSGGDPTSTAGCASAHLDGRADERAVLRPRAVVVLDV